MRKINDFENNVLKVKCVKKDLKFKFFRADAEIAKNNTNISRIYFYRFSLIFAIFVFFSQKYFKNGVEN
jgi:hypothetical protein